MGVLHVVRYMVSGWLNENMSIMCDGRAGLGEKVLWWSLTFYSVSHAIRQIVMRTHSFHHILHTLYMDKIISGHTGLSHMKCMESDEELYHINIEVAEICPFHWGCYQRIMV